MEAQLLLATIAQRYHLEPVKEQRIVLDPSVTLRPGAGLRMIAHVR